MMPNIEQLSHTTIIVGNRQKNLDMVKDFLVSSGIPFGGNPDISVFEGEQFLMADAEAVIGSASSKGLSGRRFCIISADRIAVDVQNTLLKTLEEPYPGMHFMLLLPSVERVLPTVLSRSQVVEGDRSVGASRLDVDDFLKKNIAGRFEYVETWTKAKKDEDNVSKAEILSFVDSLERRLWDLGNRDEQLFADLRKMKDYAGIRGASHRVILDFIGMICPVVK